MAVKFVLWYRSGKTLAGEMESSAGRNLRKFFTEERCVYHSYIPDKWTEFLEHQLSQFSGEITRTDDETYAVFPDEFHLTHFLMVWG